MATSKRAGKRVRMTQNSSFFHPFPGGPKGHERLLSTIFLFFEQEVPAAFLISHSTPSACPLQICNPQGSRG